MFFPEQFRKIKKAIATLLLCTVSISFFDLAAYADSSAFSAGEQAGKNSLNAIRGSAQGGVTLPSFGASSATNLGDFYPGNGKDNPAVISDLMSAGSDSKGQTCSENDAACKARNFAGNKYGSQQNNPYTGIAQDMRSKANQINPEEYLGLNNLPSEGPTQLCTQTTTTLPASTEERKCLDATLQQTTIFTKLPTTVGHEYTSPICIDPEYTLNSDKSLCIKNYYSCPNGGELDGTTCVKTEIVETPGENISHINFYTCNGEGTFLYIPPTFAGPETWYKCPGKNKIPEISIYNSFAGTTSTYTFKNYKTNYGTIVSKDGTEYKPGEYFAENAVFMTHNYLWDSSDYNYTNPSGVTNYQGLNYIESQLSTDESRIREMNVNLDGISLSIGTNYSLISKIESPTVNAWACKPEDYNSFLHEYRPGGKANNSALYCHEGGTISNYYWGFYANKSWQVYPDVTLNKDFHYGVFPPKGMDINASVSKSASGYVETKYIVEDDGSIYFNYGGNLTDTGKDLIDATKKTAVQSSYPATQHYDEVSPGCLGGPEYSAGQLVKSEPTLVDGTQSGGTKTCESELYSCPDGMAMNGAICEDVNRMQYESDPNCVNLGYVPEKEAEGYLCVTQELRECDTMPEDCTQTDEECIWVDQVSGSPTEGQCIAKEKTFSCPTPGETITQEQCSYQPMCIDGNCFTPENKCAPIDIPDTTKTYSESCQVLTEEKIESCENSFLYSEPDEDGDRHIIEAGPYDYDKVWNEQTKQYEVVRTPKASCEWFNHDNCLLAPTRMEVDSDGNATWPQNSYFSCLGDTLDLCASEPDFEYQIDPATGEYALDEDGKPIASIAPDAKPGLDSDPECTLTGQEVTQYSIADESIPIATIKKYSCERQLTLPTDTCTDDFAKMAVAMEASREGGEYFDPDTTKIFKGEFHRCDRRSANWGGAGYGSKSCCNISAPDPQTNSDIMEDAKQSIAMDAVGSIAKYAVTTGSSYMYDWMMKSQTFADTAQKLSGYATKISQLFETTEQASNAASATENASNLSNMTVGVSYAGIGISYGAGVAVGTSTTTAMGTTMYGLGGNMALTFNPYMFAIVVAIKMFEAYQAALACDQTDYETATLKKAKLCYSYGSWCERESSGIFGSTCEVYRTGHCCYNSVLARIINEQGRQQLGLPMEVCDGFTVNEIQQLDWNEIDLSEFISIMLEKAQESIPTADDMERLKAKFSSNAGVSASTNKQPIDQTFVDGERKPHH